MIRIAYDERCECAMPRAFRDISTRAVVPHGHCEYPLRFGCHMSARPYQASRWVIQAAALVHLVVSLLDSQQSDPAVFGILLLIWIEVTGWRRVK